MTVTECMYCDNSFPPKNYDGDLVCSCCGAEWNGAKYERELTERELEEIYNMCKEWKNGYESRFTSKLSEIFEKNQK